MTTFPETAPLVTGLNEALEAFGLAEASEVARYGAGHINDTFKVDLPATTAGPRSYLLQRISQAFADPAGLMANIMAVTGHLKRQISQVGGDPERETLTVRPTCDGRAFHTTADARTWRVFDFIDGAVCHQAVTDLAIFRQSAQAFGLFARRLEDFPAASLTETIPHFHDTPARYAAFEAAVVADAQGRAAACAPEIEFVRARRADCSVLTDQLAVGALPLRVTHNDTKLNNILFDPARATTCVIDLDTVMSGLTAYDFGDAIRFGANTAAEDETDLSEVHFSLPHFQAYAEGFLAAAGDSLTAAELASLPWGARLMTLECGLRFLTDHLQGDTYFHTTRPDHNLDRCRTQFALLAEMEAQAEAMDRIIAELS